jgi:hypothetical protein
MEFGAVEAVLFEMPLPCENVSANAELIPVAAEALKVTLSVPPSPRKFPPVVNVEEDPNSKLLPMEVLVP